MSSFACWLFAIWLFFALGSCAFFYGSSILNQRWDEENKAELEEKDLPPPDSPS